MNRNIQKVILTIVWLFFCISSNAQLYNDGPIRLRVWAHKVWSSANCGEFVPDNDKEYTIRDIAARVDNGNGTYIQSSAGLNIQFTGPSNRYYPLPQAGSTVPAGIVTDAVGYKLLDVTYPTTKVPYMFDVTFGSSFENDCPELICGGNRMTNDECCCVTIPLVGTICAQSDDYEAFGNWTAVNFRGGAPGVVNYSQPIVASAGGEHKYTIIYAYQWDWLEAKTQCPSPKYKDGNHTVTCELVGLFSDNDWDGGVCGIGIGGDEDLRLKIQAVDEPTSFTTFGTGSGSTIKISQSTPQWNTGALTTTSLFGSPVTSTYTNSYGSYTSLPVKIFEKNYTAEQNDSIIKVAYDIWEEDSWFLSVLGLGVGCGTDDEYNAADAGGSWYCNLTSLQDDDAHVTTLPGNNYANIPAAGFRINWRNGAPYEAPSNIWNYVDVPVLSNVGSGSSQYDNYFFRLRYKWTMANPSAVTVDQPDDLTLCGTTPVTYTATASQATYYQWQVANQSSGPGGAICPLSPTWTNVTTSGNCSTYTPPATSGTRVYRVIAYNRTGPGSMGATGAKYDSVISVCKRLTYLPVGVNASPIVSAACGASTFENTPTLFSATLAPDINAIGGNVTYQWSTTPATAVIANPTSTSTNITFPTAGIYTVTLTHINATCGNTISTCTVNVSTSSCNYIYVSSTGSDANTGTETSPKLTLQGALSLAGTTGLTHIRVASGIYNTSAVINLLSNVLIEGGFDNTTTPWTKNDNNGAALTIINSTATGGAGNTQHTWAINANGVNGWKLQDLTITTANAVGLTPGLFGKSSYGIYINGCNNWNITRCNISSGNATAGEGRVATPANYDGGNGGNATSNGGTGSQRNCDCNVCPFGSGSCNNPSGGGGGNGGAAGTGALYGGSNGSSGTNGGTGGAGGNQCQNGGAGSGGASGGAQACGGCNDQGGAGGTGAGTAAGVRPTAGVSGSTPVTAAFLSGYYLPQSGTNGTGGVGGARGEGGGGGGGTEEICVRGCGFICTCTKTGDSGAGGGGGGGSGGGGGGGAGGKGGGASYAVFVYNNGAISSIADCQLNTGVAGAGGAGGTGGTGGSGSNGGNGGAGQQCQNQNGSSSCANTGGCGGNGGRGQDGANGGAGGNGRVGDRFAVGNVSAANVYSTVNEPSKVGLTSYIVNSSANGGSIPYNTVRAQYYLGCINSSIPMNKGGLGNWSSFDAGGSIVSDIAPNTSSWTMASATPDIFYSSGISGFDAKDIIVPAGTTFRDMIYIKPNSRSLPDINLTKHRICNNETVTMSIISNNPNLDATGTAADIEWRWRKYKDGTVRTSPVPAWVSGTGTSPAAITLSNSTTDTITYLFAARVNDKCCGWSIWQYDSVVVFPDLTPSTAWTSCGASNGANVCAASPVNLCVNNPTGHTVLSFAEIQYRVSIDGGTTWTAWSAINPSNITKVVGTTIVQTRHALINTISTSGLANCSIQNYPTDFAWVINEDVAADANLVDIVTCGNPNASATLVAATPLTGSGSWSAITAPSGVSTIPSPLPDASTTLIVNNIAWGNSLTYRWTVTNGACSSFDDVTFAIAPTNINNITQDTLNCYTCPLVDGNTYTYFDVTGKIVCKIEDLTGATYSTNSLGNTEVCIRRPTPANGLIVPAVNTHGYSDKQPYLKRYFSISPADANIFAKVTLYFTEAERAALETYAAGTPYAFSGTTGLQVSKFPGGGGLVFSGPNNDPNGNLTSGGEMIVDNGYSGTHPNWQAPVFAPYAGTEHEVSFIVDQFSTFYIHPVRFPYEVLPLELVSFTGINIGDRNRLDWVTASEVNSKMFIVEKSLDGVGNWFYVGELPAAGNSNSTKSYSLFDLHPVVGNNYYRLKMVDLDETFEYSNTLKIVVRSLNITNDIIASYPNPTKGEYNIVITSSSDYNASFNVYDILGKIVYNEISAISEGINTKIFNFKNLANASYVIEMVDNTGVKHKLKFIKQ